MEKLPDKSIKNKIYNAIFRDIIHSEFPFDEYLTEKALMERYGVSRAPVREALMQLRSDRLISAVPRHGYRIRKPDRQELCDIVNFRSILECTFLEQYHAMIQPDRITELRQLCHQYNAIDQQDQNFINYWRINASFHAQLFACYGNEFALRALADAIDRQVIYFVEIMKNHYLAADLHFAMLDYLEKGDVQTALTLLRADIEKIPLSDTLQPTRDTRVIDPQLYSISIG